MNFDSYITSNTKTALTVKNYTEFVNKTDFNKKKFSLKKSAFTLAETLITLTIIGVIAALTIPNLISSYQKHTYVVGLKKAYSQLQNAMKMIPITQGCSPGDYDCAGWNDIKNIDGQEFNGNIGKKQLYLLSKQFKINKLCYRGSTDSECVNATNNLYSATNNTTISALFISNDGMIWFTYASDRFLIDINSFKGPNKYGRDQFYFDITNEYEESRYNIPQGTVVPWGSKLSADVHGEGYYWRNNNYCTTENVNKGEYGAEYCAGRVLEEDAMNY